MSEPIDPREFVTFEFPRFDESELEEFFRRRSEQRKRIDTGIENASRNLEVSPW